MKRFINQIFMLLILFPALVMAQDKEEFLHLLKNQPEGINRVATLQRLAAYYIFKPKEESADLNLAASYLKESLEISRSLNHSKGIGGAYILFYQLYREKGQAAKSMQFAEAAFKTFSDAKLYELQGDAYLAVCKNLWNSDKEINLKLELLSKAIQVFEKTSARQKIADTYRSLGDQLYYSSEFGRALSSLEKSLQLYKDIDVKEVEGVYSMISNVNNALGNIDEGVKYALLAIKTAELTGDKNRQMGVLYTRAGVQYIHMNDYTRAHEKLKKGLRFAEQYMDTLVIYQATNSIVKLLVLQKKYNQALKTLNILFRNYDTYDFHIKLSTKCNYIDIYLKKGSYVLASRYCDEILNEAKKRNANISTMQDIYQYCMLVAYAEKNYEKAQYYLDKAKDESMNFTLVDKKNQYLWQYSLDSVHGNFLSAIKNLLAYQKINDSLYNLKKSKQISELEIKYETDQKEQNIMFLSKERNLEKQKSQQAKKIRNIAFGGAGLILIIAALLYMAYQSKINMNKTLRHKQAEITDKNNSLSHLLNEKEWLLKEIHHRVKNNLQMVMSLLNSQSAYLKDKQAKSAIKDSQRRIHSMSLIHKKLYQSDNLAAIPMSSYIHEFVGYLKDSFNAGHINFKITVNEINFEVTQAVPVGLILNEAVTNSIKYAFTNKKECIVNISLLEENNICKLVIRDNGKGIPEDFETGNSNTLGMRLMQGLSGDLKGKLEIFNDNGAVIKINFARNINCRPIL
ncbi:histidine kinase dimerization/phosphoacceptor domain -containing protein [Pedobacter chinensis]|nr:histidine kinase dimerization/phosphoacceptor domain -containing protein [Pedobacter chinensis]